MAKKILDFPAPPRATHKCVPALQTGVVECALVGCGGNGAQMLSRLARLDWALREVGHPGGIHVTAFDPDIVTRANVGRQLFSPADIGQHKAVVLVTRLNQYFGLDWCARPEKFAGMLDHKFDRVAERSGEAVSRWPRLLITCVDTAKTRREIHRALLKSKWELPAYWLDLGNKKADGQVILGQPPGSVTAGIVNFNGTAAQAGALLNLTARTNLEATRLPMVTEVFPELLNAKLKEDNEPSCSLADALSKQSLFVNDAISTFAAQLLDQLLRVGEIEFHGAFINLATGRVNPLPVPQPRVAERPAQKSRARRAA